MAISKDFVLAGTATFTVEVPEPYRTEKPHYTFRVEYVPAGDRWPEAWFVKILTGPDNTQDYAYVGKLDSWSGHVMVTAKSTFGRDAYPVQLLNRILHHVWNENHQAYERFGFRAHHVGLCGRCGRVLTVPRSIETGIGPECARRMAIA